MEHGLRKELELARCRLEVVLIPQVRVIAAQLEPLFGQRRFSFCFFLSATKFSNDPGLAPKP
jgi:hypothetical protein